ncbi:MAG: hypothetical protein ACFFB0_03375 [Promethearchaeota archaeon]
MKKVRGKHAPIAEVIDNKIYNLSVKSIYDLKEKFKNLFLFIVKNYSKNPKLRYFLACTLANNSSDFIVQLARDFAVKNNLQLIQYSIFPRSLRIQLISLKEIRKIEDYNSSNVLLIEFRKKLREKFMKLKRIVENE